MTATQTTMDDFCFSLRLKAEEYRFEAWAFAKDVQRDPLATGKVEALAHTVALATRLHENLRSVIDQTADADSLEWLCWAESFVETSLAEVRRAYRVAQFHADPSRDTMAAARGWYADAVIAAARSRLTP